jgi:hypothetical protein
MFPLEQSLVFVNESKINCSIVTYHAPFWIYGSSRVKHPSPQPFQATSSWECLRMMIENHQIFFIWLPLIPSCEQWRKELLTSIALHPVPMPMPMPMPTHTHGFWVGMGAMLLFMSGHGWAWVGISFVHPCIQLQIRAKLLGCREYAYQ